MPRKKTKTKSSKFGNRPRKTTSFLEKSQVGISLTSEAVQNLNEIVTETGLSKSKVVEALVTGSLAIASDTAEKTISIKPEPDDSTTKIKVLDEVSDKDASVESSREEKQIKAFEDKIDE